MSLNSAHEGYEYQDLLTAFFILKEILNENNSTFKIDTKEYLEDKIDDLTITNSFGVFKKQIKYSNKITNQRLKKEFISQESTYKLALDTLFHSWNNHPHKNNCEIRLCLAWQKPIDELINVSELQTATPSFSSHTTQIYQIDINKLWPNGQTPLQSWNRFRKESVNINRTDFEIFCNHLVIETNFPKQSPNTSFSGELETIVLNQIKKLGIGEFPNTSFKPKAFAFELIHLIRISRSRGFEIKTEDIFKKLNIQTDFGSIEQVFPINNPKNIKTKTIISEFKNILSTENKIILTGEPGSGKSWFIQNLQNELQNDDYNIIKHYCYTELNDKHLKDRITLNVFYGNLINDIIKAFPLLKNNKEQRYASNLSELNNLLQCIDKEALLIIDGLDHINRIYESFQSDLSLNDIDIIKAIGKLQTSDKVKILVVSQPINELKELSGYKQIKIPNWTKSEIIAYFLRNNISDTQITEEKSLSDFLLEKSNGNPLYINYLCEEISKLVTLDIKNFDTLPVYSFNLTNYYNYLITKINTRESIPRILSGATFSLSKTELNEITGEGDYVVEILETLSPILKQNNSQGGYLIYHESFRRFMIEQLKSKDVSIYQNVFKPLIEWFKKKGFFNFPKAYRFYFQLLYENRDYDEILTFLNNDFITQSIYYGYSFDSVKNNYFYLAKSALKQKDFPKIIQANEINKVLSSTEHAYDEGFSLYLSALGHLRGFKTLADYLVFEEKSTLPLLLGLKACYICSQQQEPAPWDLYFDYFDENQDISESNFKYYIRGLLVFKDTETLIKMAEKIFNHYPHYIKLFAIELLEYHNSDYINEIKSKNQIFDKLINNISEKKIITSEDLLSLSQQLLEKDHIFEDELSLLNSFFLQVEYNIKNTNLIEQIIQLFTSKNWFFNWIIYFIKIKSLQVKSNSSYLELKNAFQYLIFDTEHFKGKIRTCDLYSVQNFIYNSFNIGLKLIKKSEEWDEIIELLVKLSNDTTTSLQKSISGPLATDKLFKILDEHANNINRKKIIKVFERLIIDKMSYHLHIYIAEYYFRLSKQCSIVDNKTKAEINFKEGIEFLLGYTFRRDLTIEDILNAIESYANLDNIAGSEYLKKMKTLIDAVVNHTDGKDTKWFPVEWFQEYFTINYNEASLYLLSQMKRGHYYWIYEEQLQDLLIKANGGINPIIELFIYLTFPVEASEIFLSYGLKLIEEVKTIDFDLAKIFLSTLYEKTQNKRNQGFTKNFSTKLKQLLDEFNFNSAIIKNNSQIKEKYGNKINQIELIKMNSIHRKGFSDMTIQELIEYFSKQKIKETDLIFLCYYFDNQNNLTSELRELIKTIVENNEEYPKNKNIDITIIFNQNNDISAYFWICQFMIERDGGYRYLCNIESCKKAYSINPQLTINSIIELSDKFLEIGINRTFSSNLLKALIEVGYQSNITTEMWKILYNATEFRLPAKKEIDWNELLSNNFDLDIDEIFICILFSRFKSNTTERHHWILSGLFYLYQLYPEKMIKPTKWFLQNYKHFLKVNLLIILEILYDISKKDKEYHKNFEKELNNLYPTNYYLIDFIIEYFLSKKKAQIISGPKLIFTAKQKEIEIFKNINYRNEILYNKNFDFKTIIGKYHALFRKENEKKFEFLGNRAINQFVKNIYPANYLLELINQELYSEFSEYYNQHELYDFLHVDYKTIIAQTNSYIIRPLDINKPSLIHKNWQKRKVVCTDWIRLGYYEFELYEKNHNNNKEYRIFEGIVFKKDIKKTIPFSRYRIFPKHLWENLEINGLDEFLCLSLIQKYDTLEDYKILWLNSIIINKLNLEIEKPINGLAAKNNKNEVVIKYNCWSSDYVGNSEIAGIRDEIPRLEGAELICHKDYFKKICELYGNEKPYFFRLKI